MTAPRSRTKMRTLAAALLLAALASPARAQDLPEPGDGFTWERVGDFGLDVRALVFGPDSTLWATGDDGPFRLDTTDGFPGAWVLVYETAIFEATLPIGGDGPGGPDPDTLVAVTLGSTRRSVDGGQTWEVVHNTGGSALYEIPPGLPHAGRILTGALSAIAYSDDRGASFTPSIVPGQPGSYAGANGFVALPTGSTHAGRILAAGRWGVNVSDDGGATFRESGLWQAALYYGEAVGVVERPDGGYAVIAGGLVNAQPLARAWASADAGETWHPDGGGQPLVEGPPNVTYGVEGVLSLGGPSVLVVLHKGTVYRTDDAGQTWVPIGRAPEISSIPSVFVTSAVLGPDRRLYVGLQDNSAEEGWVWRTAETHEPKPVASEPEPEETSLGVEVVPNPSRGAATVVLTLARPSSVSASVYDVLGRRVALLHEGPLAAERHTFVLDGAALPAGVYVVRVAAEEAVATARLTLVR